MTENQNNEEAAKKKELMWMVLFTVLPVSLLWPLGEFFTEDSTMRIIIGGVLGGLGGLVGYGLYYWLKEKSTTIKVISLVLLFGIGIVGIRTAHLSQRTQLATCEVCGYHAIAKDAVECGYRYSDTWDVAKNENESKEAWLKEEQLFYNEPNESGKVVLYGPKEDEGFLLDENWRPMITEQEAIESWK